MNKAGYEQTVLFEHRFWLQILGDHSRFIFNSLSPAETEDVFQARQFMQLFDRLLNQSWLVCSSAQLDELTNCAYEFASNIRCFKLDLLRRHLAGEIRTASSPTFFNHMVNEVEEYLRILECLLAKQTPAMVHPVHHHLLWVLDAEGHAASLARGVDMAETQLKEKSEVFTTSFKELYLKAVELKGYLRTGIEQFPALTHYNSQVEKEILLFNEFLCKLLELMSSKKALGILTPLTPDHFLREQCYFLTKLAQVAEITLPECDPTRPRIE